LPAEAGKGASLSLANQLRQVLTTQGWIAVVADDGSTSYRAPAAPQTPTSPAVDPRPTPAQSLRRQLESLGWVAEPAEDGGVYYRPPEVQPARTPTLADQLRSQLEQRGWTASTAADGSMIYSRPRASSPPVDDPGAGGGALARQLRETLEARGWTAVPAADGSVTYRPPAPGEPAVPPPEGASAAPGQAVDTGSAAAHADEPAEATADPVSLPEAPEPEEADEPGDSAPAGPQLPAQAATAGGESGAGAPSWHPRRQAWYPGYPPRWLPPQGWRHMQRPSAPVWQPMPWGRPSAMPYPHRRNALDR
jgi:hypothetical protein